MQVNLIALEKQQLVVEGVMRMFSKPDSIGACHKAKGWLR
jgi:hypothetical protein